jgi:hypothetical protein
VQVHYVGNWVQRVGKTGTQLLGGVVVMQTRTGLVGVDLYSGQTLWQRDGEGVNGDLFGDDQYVAVVERNSEGAPSHTRVLRVGDGGAVMAPNFVAAYENRVQTIGRDLVALDKGGKEVTLRRGDVLTGKDVAKETYPAGTRALHSEAADLYGVVEPGGKVHVFGAVNVKERLTLEVDPKHLANLDTADLYADDRYLYLACNRAADPALMPWGGIQSNLVAWSTGISSRVVNGELYAFDRDAGKLHWHNEVLNQTMVLDHFAEMPVLLFTSRYTRWVILQGENKLAMQFVATQFIRKSNGKLIYFKEDNNMNQQQFTSLTLDPAKGEIVLGSPKAKLQITFEK